uniref:Uncharacterized protein LOC104235387 n=1 Tax=Nicotiana sylvestris TaxID=4096 RepID=A0A1U7XLQ3_NICSY|nr:PREDICTED: uncharacterized protein LOC104235387 [Nicotiana sylvestris]
MKLNLEKCAFGVGSGKFLEFMVSNRGIKINPDRIKVIKGITVVDNVKTPECQQVLEELKWYLSSPSLLHTPKADKQLYLYISVFEIVEWTLEYVPRDQNSNADALANLGLWVDDDEFSSKMIVQLMKSVVGESHTDINSTSLTWDWRNKKLPSDPKESRVLRIKAARFSLSEDNILVRRMFNGPLAICLRPGDTEYVLREAHEGTCENHSGAES